MKKTKKALSLAKESVTVLSAGELGDVAGGYPTRTDETVRCSRAQGSCLSCGPTFCPG